VYGVGALRCLKSQFSRMLLAFCFVRLSTSTTPVINDIAVDIFHLERVAHILDQPRMARVRDGGGCVSAAHALLEGELIASCARLRRGPSSSFPYNPLGPVERVAKGEAVATFSASDEFAGYRILRPLGAGGMGQVWLAEHIVLGRLEALKVVSVHAGDSQFAERFTNEARTAASLDHPGIVTVYAYGITEGTPWFTMSYLDGEDLDGCGQLPPAEVATIVERIADALDYAHARGVIHRDIKPANVIVQRTPGGDLSRVTVLDFGIARLLDGTALTATNAFIGTLAYAPPETLTGQRAMPPSDQYSLACTAFHLLAGQPPFSGDNPGALMMKHINGPVPRLSDTAPWLAPMDAVLARGMAKFPADRFATAGQFAAALRAAVPACAQPAAPPPSAPAPAPATNVNPAITVRRETQEPVAHEPTEPWRTMAAPRPSSGRSARTPLIVLAAVVTLIAAAVVGVAVWPDGSKSRPSEDVARSTSKSLDAAGDVPIRALSAGTINVCAAGQDGTAYCWGSVGIDDGPEKVAGPPNVTAIVSDVGTYCAIGGGDLYCWGSYEHGELGNGMVGKIGDSEPTPQKVEGLSNVTSVAIESGTVCAVASAAIYCWGDNPVGQLGNGTTEPSARPVRVEGLGAATSVTMGFGTVCAVAADEAWCWGNNRYGQLGDGTTERQFTPRRVGGLGRVTAVATSSTVSCGISDETLYCWGNASGLLGTPEPSGSHSTPVPVPGFGKVSGLALGGNVTQGADNTLKSSHSVLCAVTDGRPVCAGANDAGQLGSGNTEPQTAPVTVPGLSSVTQVVAGASFACALSDGHTYCWGDGFDDAHGKGPGLTPTQVHWPT